MKSIKLFGFSLVLFFLAFSYSQGQNIHDYLILQDIGNYKFITQTKDFITGQIKTIPGYTTRNAPGILAGADHFDEDHDDTTNETNYVNRNIQLSVGVQVTQHAGSDSDKWLLHEVEDSFRKDKDLNATYVAPNPIRQIDGNTIWYTWGYYQWVSNYVVISITFTDLSGTKPEPLEVVRAYLAKHPSTIKLTDWEVKSRAHNEKWIKDEMERRLWLCDRWFLHLQMGKAAQDVALREIVDQMEVFLDYRGKYYGIKGQDEKSALSRYLNVKDGTSIKTKLTEYKTWWSVNKTKSISLP